MIEKQLLALAQNEFSLMEIVSKSNGTIESKTEKLIQQGVDKKFNEIYESYFALSEKFSSIEALKRCTFLQWYAVSEPLAFTGLGDLNRKYQEKVIVKIKNICEAGTIDIEFKAMLNHYLLISDWYFISFDDFLPISNWLQENTNGLENIKDLDNRGQMGKYWRSILQ